MRLRHKTWQEEMISSHKDIALEKTAIDEKSIPPFNMLEIGSGCGLFLLELAKKHPENQYLGVEIQRTAFAIGIKNMLLMKIDLQIFIILMPLLKLFFQH